MGDSWTVEFAQQAHHNVLRFLAGSMLEHERVAYRKAFPRSIVSAPKHRIGALMLCTVLVAKRGTATPTMLSALLGCWINVLMFRRPIFSVLSHVFTAGKGCKPNQLFVLDRQSRNELLAIALLGPVCMTDLRVDVAPALYCTDASPDWGNLCLPRRPQSYCRTLAS